MIYAPYCTCSWTVASSPGSLLPLDVIGLRQEGAWAPKSHTVDRFNKRGYGRVCLRDDYHI